MCDSDIILLVEDDPDDVFLMKRALKAAGISDPLHVVEHGQAALDYLAGTGGYADRTRHPFPSLVFLDLKLPYKSGFEVLSWFREQPSFELAAVVVLTSSGLERDMHQAYKLGARSYLVKPPTREMLLELMGSLNSFRGKKSTALESTITNLSLSAGREAPHSQN